MKFTPPKKNRTGKPNRRDAIEWKRSKRIMFIGMIVSIVLGAIVTALIIL